MNQVIQLTSCGGDLRGWAYESKEWFSFLTTSHLVLIYIDPSTINDKRVWSYTLLVLFFTKNNSRFE